MNYAAITLTSREEVEVHRFSWVASFEMPLLAIFVQSFFTRHVQFLETFDLPLLVTIFFAVARRRPIPGMLTGALIGTLQDSIAGIPVGLNGIAKTIIGYLASSLGVKLDVDNPGSRFLMTFAFYIIHRVVYVVIAIWMAGMNEAVNWTHSLIAALANGLLAVVLFALLDRLKERA
jgi:rod shape-determining protein MreD